MASFAKGLEIKTGPQNFYESYKLPSKRIQFFKVAMQ